VLHPKPADMVHTARTVAIHTLARPPSRAKTKLSPDCTPSITDIEISTKFLL
jgi:hypothetical protein